MENVNELIKIAKKFKEEDRKKLGKNPPYYYGDKLLGSLDLDGLSPEIFISSSNNSAGKSTFLRRLAFQNFLTNGEEFLLLNRYNYEIFQEDHKFFDEIHELFYPNFYVGCASYFRGKITEIYIGEPDEKGKLTKEATCGWSIALNDADLIKTCSHMFHNVGFVIFDEFQNSDNKYLTGEIDAFIKIHKAIARGHGKQSRYVPTLLASNFCTLLNPYYVELGVSDRLKKDTHYLRGHGWVVEQFINQASAKAISESRFARAFSESKEMQMGSELVYVFDDYAFCEKPTGKNDYLYTIKIDGVDYGLRQYENGLIWCTDKPDPSCPVKFAFGLADHGLSYRMLSRNSMLVMQLREYFQNGNFRFENLACRNAIIQLLRF